MAGRIPRAFIEELLARVDIVELIGRYVPLKKAGADYQALCPFHEEKTPSFTVSPGKQFYYCFGCTAKGSAVGFIMSYMSLDYIAAIETLAEHLGLEVPREGASTEPGDDPRPLYALMEEVVTFYRRQLRNDEHSQQARQYLAKRAIDADTVQRFQLGYAPQAGRLLKLAGNSRQKRQGLLKLGLLKSRHEGAEPYDTFRQRLIFPIYDSRGRAIGLGGRALDPEQQPKYLNSSASQIFHKGRELYGLHQAIQADRKLERLYVVEGYMDVLTLAQAGIRNTVATLGTSLTTAHVNVLLRRCHDLVLCFDGDAAGRQAARRAMENTLPALREGMQVQFRFLPEDHDPDSYIRDQGAQAFLDPDQHTPLSEYLLETVQAGLDLQSMEQRARLTHRAAPYLQSLPEGTLRQLLHEKIARLCGLSAERLGQHIRAQDQPGGRAGSESRAPPRPTMPPGPLSTAISALLCQPGLAHHEQVHTALQDMDGVEPLRKLVHFIVDNPDCHTGQILEHWHDTTLGARLRELVPIGSIYRDDLALQQEDALRETLLGALRLLRRRNAKKWLGELAGIKSVRDLTAGQLERLRALSSAGEQG